MEFAEVLFLVMAVMIGSAFLIFIWKFAPNLTKNKRNSQPKTPVEGLLKEQVREIQENYQLQITNLKKEKQSLQNTINRIRTKVNDEEDEEENELDMTQYYIDKTAAAPFLKNLGMNPDGLDSPVVQQLVADKLKGNEELALLIGLIKPKSQLGTQPNQASNQSNFSNEFENLVASGQVA